MYLELLIHEIIHIAAYLILVYGLIQLLKLKDVTYKDILVGLAVTVGMDVDHFFDFFLYKGRIALNIKEFIDLNYFVLLGKTYLPLHAWEWVVLVLTVYILLKRKHKALLFIALGLIVHLLVDTLSYGFDWQVYFITFRFLNNFDQAIFLITPG